MENSSNFDSFVEGYRYDFGVTHERIDGVDEDIAITIERLEEAEGRIDSHQRLIRSLNELQGELHDQIRELRNEVERAHHNSVARDNQLRAQMGEPDLDLPVILVPGTFDTPLHAGHLNLLRYAASLGHVRVSMGSTEWASARKERQIAEWEQRRSALLATGYVWQVDGRRREPELSLGSMLRRDWQYNDTLPDLIVAGSDWASQHKFLEHHDLTWKDMEELGIGVAFIARTPGVSSSDAS